MATSNRQRVELILSIVREALGVYALSEIYRAYGPREAHRQINYSLTGINELPRSAFDNDEALLAAIDTQKLFNLMYAQWREVFHEKLDHIGRSYIGELHNARNRWAHEEPFTKDQTRRVADTAKLLLEAISAHDEAVEVEEIRREMSQSIHQARVQKMQKAAQSKAAEQEVTTTAGLKPWREVVNPHPDVSSGRYIQAEFAADLAQVLENRAQPEYQDPVEFFRRTYLTEGLLNMLVTGIKRLTAQGGDPVVQLKTSFGGGKTHSMLALYHLVGGQIGLGDFPGGERIEAAMGPVDLPEAQRAVLVGTALNPTRIRDYRDAVVHTLWGELAYQLGGAAAYAYVAEADEKGVSPGSNTLRELLYDFGPALIVIDELVAYARNIYGVEGLPSGTFEAVMSFMQSLTEAVKRTEESMLLVSLPASNIEVGGSAGREALDRLTHTIGRVEAVWKPVTPTESFEIVRRRLFTDALDTVARDAVLESFRTMYRDNPNDFPQGTGEQDYLERMRSAYPIHPELFDRLYQDWSTLERFQRTRGVLRLMASVIHQLWINHDQSLLILPGTLPLFADPVRNEMLRYLDDAWPAVFDTDIDGEGSLTLKLDGQIPNLGRYNASRRVARTIFVGSAPSSAEQSVRGLEAPTIALGAVQPGEPPAVFGDALRRMSSQLTYLYSGGNRYWYDTRPTVNRLARDRAQNYSIDVVSDEIVKHLRRVPKSRDLPFAAYHVAPRDTSEVTDDDRARVVVLDPEQVHRRGSTTSEAYEAAAAILDSRGTTQRLYKNMLLFIAPDHNEMDNLRQSVRQLLAWESIRDEEDQLNLDAQQRKQVADSLEKIAGTVDKQLMQAYKWLLIPYQSEEDAGEKDTLQIIASQMSGDDNFYDRASNRLIREGHLIPAWSPQNLHLILERWIWERQEQIQLKQMWEYLAQYPYMPRLTDSGVLKNAVQDGVSRLDAPFAYATGVDASGYHVGVVFQSTGAVYFDAESLLVHPDALNLKVVSPKPARTTQPAATRRGDGAATPLPEAEEEPLKTRYYGRVTIDPERINKEINLIVDEVVQRLTSQIGCKVEITMEVHARLPEGFNEATQRTIGENSRTLKFDQFGFEQE